MKDMLSPLLLATQYFRFGVNLFVQFPIFFHQVKGIIIGEFIAYIRYGKPVYNIDKDSQEQEQRSLCQLR